MRRCRAEVTVDDSDEPGIKNANFPFRAEFYAATQAACVSHGRRTSASDFDVVTWRNVSAAGGFGKNFFSNRFPHAQLPMCARAYTEEKVLVNFYMGYSFRLRGNDETSTDCVNEFLVQYTSRFAKLSAELLQSSAWRRQFSEKGPQFGPSSLGRARGQYM